MVYHDDVFRKYTPVAILQCERLDQISNPIEGECFKYIKVFLMVIR